MPSTSSSGSAIAVSSAGVHERLPEPRSLEQPGVVDQAAERGVLLHHRDVLEADTISV